MQLHNVVEIASKRKTEIVLMKLQTFDEVTQVIQALKAQKIVLLNLSLVSTEMKRRIIDFLAGGVCAADCQQAYIGETVFLLASDRVVLSQIWEQE